ARSCVIRAVDQSRARRSSDLSASLVNKGLEVIEAHLLFDVPFDAIEVTVHPQSLVHSMVEFVDGSTIAQASPPDMKLPISLALRSEEHTSELQSPEKLVCGTM